ncbi:MAG TPA: hypothetical protein ENK91_09375, partial [Bacteroidetes bacterium]|nr:hypothetical protein [Bacteroidota bacterium]
MSKINNILLLFLTAFLLVSSSSHLSGQNELKIANKLFKADKYCLALPYYNTYLDKFVNKKAYVNRGICNYKCNHIDQAIEDLKNAVYLGSYDEKINLYLAKSFHDKQEFEKAIVYYKKYLADINSNKIERQKIIDNIKRCANGVSLKYKKTNHFIENWGTEINTSFDEILPLQSPQYNSTFYFSSNRTY